MLCSKQVVEAKLLEAKKLCLKNFAPSLKSYMGKNYHLICIWQPITLTVSETMVLFFTSGFLLFELCEWHCWFFPYEHSQHTDTNYEETHKYANN